jgi:hypothetical protein
MAVFSTTRHHEVPANRSRIAVRASRNLAQFATWQQRRRTERLLRCLLPEGSRTVRSYRGFCSPSSPWQTPPLLLVQIGHSRGERIRWRPTSAPAHVPPCRTPTGLVAMTNSSVRQFGTDHGPFLFLVWLSRRTVEPISRLELETCGLRNRCSTTELNRRGRGRIRGERR